MYVCGSREDASRPFEGFAVRSERLLSSSFPQCKVDGKESCLKLAEPDVSGADGLLRGGGERTWRDRSFWQLKARAGQVKSVSPTPSAFQLDGRD